MEGSRGEHPANDKTTSHRDHTTKGKDHYNNTNRKIDHQELANMLRESANLVERGEFDSILYEALQDFRVYYKQKYPKTSKRKKKPHITKENEKGSNLRTKSETTTTATTASESKDKNSAGSTILKDLKESENTTMTTDKQKEEDDKVEQDFSSGRTTGNSSEEIMANNETDNNDANVDVDVDTTVKEIYDICANGIKSDTTTPTPAMKEEATTSTSITPENSIKINDIPVDVPISTADVSVAPPSPNLGVANTTTVPVEMADPIPVPLPPKPNNKVASTPSIIPDRIKGAHPNHSTNNRGAIFGKLKVVGATLNTVKKAALNVTGKNHHSQEKSNSIAREDLEIFGDI